MAAPDADELLDTLLRFGAEWYLESAKATLDNRMAGLWRRAAVACNAARTPGPSGDAKDGAKAHAEIHETFTAHLNLVGLPSSFLYQVAGGLRVKLGLALIEQVLESHPERYEGTHQDSARLMVKCFIQHAVEAYCVAPVLQAVKIELQHPEAPDAFTPAAMQPALDFITCYHRMAHVESLVALTTILDDPRVDEWAHTFEPWVLDLSED